MKRPVIWKRITLALFLLVWAVAAITVTSSVIDDILHYDDRFTSFPPFAGSAIFSAVTAPLLLLTLAVHAVVAKLSAGRAGGEPAAPEPSHRSHRLTARIAAAAMAFALLMVLLGTLLSARTAAFSVFFVGLRLEYLCMSYAPLFLCAFAFWLRAARHLKKDR